jgi:hypothetical protein
VTARILATGALVVDGMSLALERALPPGPRIGNGGHVVVGYYTPTWRYGRLRLTLVQHCDPPMVTAVPDRDVLTPPDGKMVWVHVNVQATDNFDTVSTCGIVSIRNSEAPAVGPDPDVQMLDGFNVSLRATRLGDGPGRTYAVVVQCTDFGGNASTRSTRMRPG